MKNAMFRVVRPFWLGGVVQQPGETIEIDSSGTVNELMRAGRVEPADAETAANLRSRPSVTWAKGQANQSNERLRFLNPF